MRFHLVLIGVWVFLCATIQMVYAQESKSDAALDAVLAIDSSGSMLITDPQRLRDEGAKLFIQSLKTGDNIGILEFSDDAKIIHELAPYSRDLDKKIADEISKIENDGTFTDLLSGIKLAQESLSKASAGDKQQIIVLFSDGKNEPDPAKLSPESVTSDLFNNYLPQLKAQGIKVHTLALSEKADKELLAQIAAATDGISIYASDANLINQAFTNLFLAVKKPQVLPLSSKGFKIDSNIQEATFYINREDESQEVTITSPSGKRFTSGLTDTSVKWFSTPKFQVITIFAPEAGQWKIEGMKSEDGFATLLTNLKLITEWKNTVSVDEQSLLEARLYESDKPVVLHGMSGNLEYAFQIVPTDKISEPIIKEFLTDDGKNGDRRANDGIFSKLVKIDEPGQYKLKVVAHSPTFDRYQHLPFQVKDRLVTLTVQSHKAAAAHAEEGHADEHDDGHSDEQHAKDGQDDHSEHGDSKTEHAEEKHAEDEASDGEGEVFIAKLSDEAQELKKLEVKLLAIDKEKNRYVVEMHDSKEHGVYELSTDYLPKAGLYDIEVTISGLNKNKKPEKATSQRIQYNLKQVSKEVEIVKKEEKKEEENSEPSVLLFLAGVTLVNLIFAGLAFAMFKKASAGPAIVMPVFEEISVTETAVQKLKDRISISEIDLSDPIYSGSFSASDETRTEGGQDQGGSESEGASEAPSEEQPSSDEQPPAEEAPPPTEEAPASEPPQEQS